MLSVSESRSWLIQSGSLAHNTYSKHVHVHTFVWVSKCLSIAHKQKKRANHWSELWWHESTSCKCSQTNKRLCYPAGEEKKKKKVRLTQNSSLHGRRHTSTKSHMTHCWFTEVTHDSVQHLESNIQDDAPKDTRWTQEKQVSAVIAYS